MNISIAAAANDTGVKDLIPLELQAVRSLRVLNNTSAAIERLTQAVAVTDALPYMEPPRWYYPVRHCLGAMLLRRNLANDADMALTLFQQDLRTYPENAWSLLGTSEAYTLLGLGDMASEYEERASVAWQTSDVDLPESPCPQYA